MASAIPGSQTEPSRLWFLDGLRGIAVLMVLVFHAWLLRLPNAGGSEALHRVAVSTPANFIASLGYQGVSLFLVISGFCLAYPAFVRHARGDRPWFSARQFLVSRYLRIAPPYYVALALFTVIPAFLSPSTLAHMEWWLSPHPTILDLSLHVLLIHNLLPPFAFSVNGAFWSLGLEWQWYWVFPLFLLLVLRWPIRTLLMVLAVGVTARLALHVYLYDGWSAYTGSYILLERLFEFCCGIAAALLVVQNRRIRARLLLTTLSMSLGLACLAQITLPAVPALMNVHPLWGLVFTSLLLLGHSVQQLNRALSWRPLAQLGVVSYSVYLVHQPVILLVETLAPMPVRSSVVVAPVSITIALGSGICFFYLIERPCLKCRRLLLEGPVQRRARHVVTGSPVASANQR